MIVFRDGNTLTVCDGCMRPKPTGEAEKWKQTLVAPERPAVSDKRPLTSPPVYADWCPTCPPRETKRAVKGSLPGVSVDASASVPTT